jgi:uncharacterized protein (TIGR03118 family)
MRNLLRRCGLATVAACAMACGASAGTSDTPTNVYTQKTLVANRPQLADGGLVDQYMINPWGIALRPPGAGGHIWISNAGSLSTSTYVGDVNGQPLHQDGLKIVHLNSPLISYEDGLANVTGQVYNAASDFPGQPVEFPVSGAASNLSSGQPVAIGTISGPAKFVFVTTEGTIHAWRASTKESMDRAIIVKDYSDLGRDQIRTLPQRPAFTGVAMSTTAQQANRLYVTDFSNKTIRVIDNKWNDITASVPFERPANMPAQFSPYNIQYLDGRLYVTFAFLDTNADEPGEDLPGPGNGRLVSYDLNGKLVQQFDEAGHLDSPWGLAIAPQNFGRFSGSLLVGNFGDGTTVAFDLTTRKFQDYLRDPKGAPLEIDGLWGFAFGNGVGLGAADSLYFTAGPNVEQDGIFGRIRYAGPAPKR